MVDGDDVVGRKARADVVSEVRKESLLAAGFTSQIEVAISLIILIHWPSIVRNW